MFDSVLGKGTTPKARFGAGTTISVLLHAAILGVVWFISTAPVDQELPELAVTFYAAPPPPPPPPPPKKKKAPVEKKPEVKKPDVISAPTVIPTEKPPEVEPPPDEPEEDDDEGEEGGVEGGVVGGVVGGVIGGVVGPTAPTEVMAFGEGMTRPQRISGQDPVYTREALEAHVQGLMIVKCVISTEGTLHNCRIIKPLPYMERAVLDALSTRRYRPVTFQGKPITCDYVFNIKLVMPKD